MTGKDIYDIALHLIGLKTAEGNDHPDCTDLLNRSPALINVLMAENRKIDRSLRGDKEARSMPISTLDDTLHCHELVAYGLLPFGLASLLVADEDAELSRSLYERYLLNLKNIKESVTSVVHKISDCYAYYG